MKKSIIILLALSINTGCKINNSEKNFRKINQEINGQKEGTHIVFDNVGNITAIKQYAKGKLDGASIYFSMKSNKHIVMSKVNYLSGRKNGFAYYFYPSGVIKANREWNDDKEVGYALDYYDTTGEVKASLLYNDDGYLIRKRIIKDGKVIREDISETFKKQLDSLKTGRRR